jgi:hypothetical protein
MRVTMTVAEAVRDHCVTILWTETHEQISYCVRPVYWMRGSPPDVPIQTFTARGTGYDADWNNPRWSPAFMGDDWGVEVELSEQIS